MPISIKVNKCKCGEPLTIISTRTGSYTYCRKRRWYNFWKHNKKHQFAWYPVNSDRKTFEGMVEWLEGEKNRLKKERKIL